MIKIEKFFWGKTRGKFEGKSLRAMGENLGSKNGGKSWEQTWGKNIWDENLGGKSWGKLWGKNGGKPQTVTSPTISQKIMKLGEREKASIQILRNTGFSSNCYKESN